jgi:hypothetical protein
MGGGTPLSSTGGRAMAEACAPIAPAELQVCRHTYRLTDCVIRLTCACDP